MGGLFYAISGLVIDLLGAMAFPVLLEIGGVLVVVRLDAEQDTAALEAFLVMLDVFLGNAPADQRTDQSAGDAAGTGTGNAGSQRAGNDQPEPGYQPRSADRGGRGSDGTQRTAASSDMMTLTSSLL